MKRSELLKDLIAGAIRSYQTQIKWLNLVHNTRIPEDIYQTYELSPTQWRLVHANPEAISARTTFDLLNSLANADPD